ncbi:concanavalin A-like lectin/glucanase domain-containing protein [Fomitopsis serialis]|uniref:concanavalin A-like lectin/glucanase domain-containing protein n=1 Tax=Fomitopsis serialis TaxID=139415 RepID=UPI00200753BA|nr:concanavalin A-like lectin/glucanase domain-containing protein [Neoantrodia serialis]KAH9930333.1 concanavalin A-like lectin/glucanase domain-containing protein [Neoantrodia serialis]
MIHALAAAVLALPLTAVAHTPTYMRRAANYTIEDHYQGEDFLNWTFFSDSDPTAGLVTYLDANAAIGSGLATVDCDNVTTLAVDTNQTVANGGTRNSVRISSEKTYSSGLFIADFAQMPVGCGTWPAYWTVSATATWPQGGEVDIIEGVNRNTQNQITLHSGDGCTLSGSPNTTSHLLGTQCASSNDNDAGCAYQQDDTTSFGAGFNGAGGGVFAHLWNTDGITVWYFQRNAIPSDITNKNPDPTSWGTPAAAFPSTSCDMASHFYDHSIVIDTTICGDWAGPAYAASGCPGTCQDAVANATNFVDAQWKINYISVYQ